MHYITGNHKSEWSLIILKTTISPTGSYNNFEVMKVLCPSSSLTYTHNVPPYLRNSTTSKYPLQHCNGTSNNDLVRHVLQLVGSFTSHKGNEDWRLVEIPKQEKLSTISCCASNMTKEIGVWIPKHSIKTQNHL